MTTDKSNLPIRCVLMGAESLLIQCAEILSQKNFVIQSVISDDPQIVTWAMDAGLPCLSPHSDYVGELEKQPFDYFFSIANLKIVPERALRLATRGAINFHDGLLPQYSGLYVTSWALLNQERTHGITWHLMGTRVDEGDILKQRTFDVDEDETAFTLNVRCYEAGVESFRELIDELEQGTLNSAPQDLDQRVYYELKKRPSAACTISWDQDAEQIDALVRALDFGMYDNPLGGPKCGVGTELFLVPEIDVLSTQSGSPPGTVVSLEEDRWIVSSASYDVAIVRLLTLEGKSVSLQDVVERHTLTEGDPLPTLDSAKAERLSDTYTLLCKNEPFWVEQLVAHEPIDIPYADRTRGRSDTRVHETYVLPFLDEAAALLAEESVSVDPDEALASIFGGYLARLSGQRGFTLGLSDQELRRRIEGLEHYFASFVPLGFQVNERGEVLSVLRSLLAQLRRTRERGTYIRDLYSRYRVVHEFSQHETSFNAVLDLVDDVAAYEPPPDAELAFVVGRDGSASWVYDPHVFAASDIAAMQEQLGYFVEQLLQDGAVPFHEVPLLTEARWHTMIREWNATRHEIPDTCIHHEFERQAELTPDAPALTCKGSSQTYRELNERANQMGHYLRRVGVRRGSLVGIFMDRSADMVVSLMGVLKAGGAYVPLDPDFPKERIAFMVNDAGLDVVLSRQALHSELPDCQAKIVCVDSTWADIAREPVKSVDREAAPDDLAYVIYTSGSTGQPKGVMVTHRNVANFFVGMDDNIEHDPPGVWLAVTSLSFDISVLELFWTLARGFHVVLYADKESAAAFSRELCQHTDQPIEFSLFYFASDEGAGKGRNRYRLLLEGARFGDENGFAAVWTPERHFGAFGGLYPNPSVTSAALATITRNIGLRAGSCVSPLHSPVRIAEEWSVVDNLSDGRAGIAFASGWQPNDFVLQPGQFEHRKEIMFAQVDQVRQLWQGGAVRLENGKGEEVDVRVLPRPVQEDLPVWITAAGNPETYRLAGEKGYNILTHLLGQDVAELTEKISVYRRAWQENGHGVGGGHVTLMLHTFVGEDDDVVRDIVRQPMKNYLLSAINLVQDAAWSFPTLKQKTIDEMGRFTIANLSEEDVEAILDHSFERYFETSGLFGSPETCLKMVDALKGIGVNEIACLVDFGVDDDVVLAQLPLLDKLKDLANGEVEIRAGDPSIAEMIRQYGVTHMQCTPSQARIILDEAGADEALHELQQLIVGGEALPPPLSVALRGVVAGKITNMYGPTETTIWSTTHTLEKNTDSVSIGTPIANTQVYVLDRQRQPVPVGIPGELYIGGSGVTPGYFDRPALRDDRFPQDPFSDVPDARFYKTGDLVKWRSDGSLEFLGRLDNQVKISGYRIELGEIESALQGHPSVEDAVVIAREDTPGDKRLVGYVIPRASVRLSGSSLRDHLMETLPEYMIPSRFVMLESFPVTPNKKIDRRALPAPFEVVKETNGQCSAPTTEIEKTLCEIWQQVLHVPSAGVTDNFFDLGGNSLIALQLISAVREKFSLKLPLRIIFGAPTVAELAEEVQSYLLNQGDGAEEVDQGESVRQTPIELIQRHALSGTQDREAFVRASPATQSLAVTSVATPPRDDIEQALTDLWAETLGVPEVGRDESFFDLGGDSLSAFQVTVGIREACGVSLPLKEIFSSPTPAEMADALRGLFTDMVVYGLAANGEKSHERQEEREEVGALTFADGESSSWTMAEKELAGIWRQILGVDRIDRHSDFFESGGTSLLAARLFVEIEGRFGQRLPLSTLFQAPTISSLARRLGAAGSAGSPRSTCLVPIQSGGTQPPFFCVHGAAGNVLMYRELARLLGDDRPFYGIECWDYRSVREQPPSLEEMAAYYLEEVRSIQPEGPYFLGGYCMGGTIAYEMAQQLNRAGQTVALVAMIDSVNTSRFASEKSAERSPAYVFKSIAFNLRSLRRGERVDYFKERVDGVFSRFRARREAHRRNDLACDVTLEDINESIDAAYRPESYDGEVVLFRRPMRNYSYLRQDPQLGWEGLATRGLRVVEIPASSKLFEGPGVVHLGRELKTFLLQSVGDPDVITH